MSELKKCPCGKVPDRLLVCINQKYHRVCGDCCGFWEIEFRDDHYKSNEKAIEAWNIAPRGE